MIKPDQPWPRGVGATRRPPEPPPMRCPADDEPIGSLEALVIPVVWTLLVLTLGILIGIRMASTAT